MDDSHHELAALIDDAHAMSATLIEVIIDDGRQTGRIQLHAHGRVHTVDDGPSEHLIPLHDAALALSAVATLDAQATARITGLIKGARFPGTAAEAFPVSFDLDRGRNGGAILRLTPGGQLPTAGTPRPRSRRSPFAQWLG